ncbi:MAG: DUF5681 domain-containing protein [Hyphomicrobiales bacterium]
MDKSLWDKIIKTARKIDYDVGYGKPPQEKRFQSGKSGNPKGRPVGAKNKPKNFFNRDSLEFIRSEADRLVSVNEAGTSKKISATEAIIRSINMDAMKGKSASQKLAMELILYAEKEGLREQKEAIQIAMDYKKKCKAEIEHCKANNLTPPKHLPNPDHVIVNPLDGSVKVDGPCTQEQIESAKLLKEIYDDNLKTVIKLYADLEACTCSDKRQKIEKQIIRIEKSMTRFEKERDEKPNFFED